MKRKLIAAALICSIMLSVFAVPSSALVTEALVIGSVVAAFASACGITILSTGNNAEEVNRFFYDKFTNWLDHEEDKIDAAEILAGVAIHDGKLRIQNGISKLLSRFMPDLVSIDVASGITSISGIGTLPIYYESATNIPYNDLIEDESLDITLTLDKGASVTGVFHPIFIRYSYWNSSTRAAYHFAYDPGNGSLSRFPETLGDTGTYVADDTILGYKLCILVKNDGSKMLATLFPRKNRSTSNHLLHYCGISDAYIDLSNYNTLQTGEITRPLPDIDIGDDKQTLIDIGTSVTDLSDLADKVGEQAAAGTLSATYTNGNPVSSIPDTNLTWVGSLHSIWEYVEYLIDQASAGFTFFSSLLAAMPVEVEFCFYGALVLLLFGGVISRLLL